MQSQKESFLAFFSYVQENDKHDRGKLTFLRKKLQAEIWAQTGKRFKIFQDVEDIEGGQTWKKRIKNALDASSLLIAIVTPSYLVSKSCRFEFEYFLEQEFLTKRKLILPILYIDTPKLNDANDKIANEISKRQWIDWKDLRFASRTSVKINKKLESLAKQIRKLIDKKVFEDVYKTIESEYLLPEAKFREPTDGITSSYPQAYKLPPLYTSILQKEDRPDPPKLITVLLRPTGDRERDKRRIKLLYGTFIAFHGRDRFSFQVFEGKKGHLIDFPKDTTCVCPEMLARLKKLIGEESWRIDEITFL